MRELMLRQLVASPRVRSAVPYAVSLVIFLALRWNADARGGLWTGHDTDGLVQASRLPFLSVQFLAGVKPPMTPIFHKLLNGDFEAIALAQVAMSIVAWVTLSFVVARSVRTPAFRPIAFAVLLAFSLSIEIIEWDRVILTETLSISVMALIVANWIWLTNGIRWHKVPTLVALTFVWAFTRDTNAQVLVVYAVILLAIGFIARRHRILLSTIAIMTVVFCLLANYPTPWSANRFAYPAMDLLGMRILPKPELAAYFFERGLPLTPSIQRQAGHPASDFGMAWATAPADAPLRAWLLTKGKATYASFLLSHPIWALTSPLNDFSEDVNLTLPKGTRTYHAPGFAPPLGGLLSWLTYPMYGGLALLTVATIWGGFYLARHSRASGQILAVWLVPLVLFLQAYPHIVLGWNGELVELARHLLQNNILMRLAAWLVIVFALDLWLRSKPLPSFHLNVPIPQKLVRSTWSTIDGWLETS